MGDRCEWHATVHPKDIKKFIKAMGLEPNSFKRTSANWAEFHEDQMADGGITELAMAAQKMLKFYGHHCGGDFFSARRFVSSGDGTLYAWPEEDRGNDNPVPYIPLDVNGWFDPRYLADIQDVMRDYDKLEAESGRK